MRFVFMVLLTCLATVSMAEPSPDVRTLMNRPLSVFDWGIFELNNDLKMSNVPGYASYNLAKNRIIIKRFDYQFEETKTMDQTKSACEEDFARFDAFFMITKGEEKPKYCAFCSKFITLGTDSNDSELMAAIHNIYDIFYYKYYDGSNTCQRKAFGETSVTVSSLK